MKNFGGKFIDEFREKLNIKIRNIPRVDLDKTLDDEDPETFQNYKNEHELRERNGFAEVGRSYLYQYIQKNNPDYVKYLEKKQRNDDKKNLTSLLRDLKIQNRNRRIEERSKNVKLRNNEVGVHIKESTHISKLKLNNEPSKLKLNNEPVEAKNHLTKRIVSNTEKESIPPLKLNNKAVEAKNHLTEKINSRAKSSLMQK